MSSVPTRRRETSPETRDPFRRFADLQQRMSQLMDSFWPDGAGDGSWSRLVDIEDGELAITGAVAEHDPGGTKRRRTRRIGRFEYRVMLPGLTGRSVIDEEGPCFATC
jgi:HSP20 family protein